MPISRSQQTRERIAGPTFTRSILKFYLVAAAIGLLVGLVWIVVGILHFHPLW